jgi:hypothetical protein
MWKEVELGKESLNVIKVTGLMPNLLGDPSRNAHFGRVLPRHIRRWVPAEKKVPPAVKWDKTARLARMGISTTIRRVRVWFL